MVDVEPRCPPRCSAEQLSFRDSLVIAAAGLNRNAGRALTRVGLIVAALAALSGLLSDGGTLPEGRWQIELHATIALFAYALLSLATVQSLLLAWTE